MYISFYADSLSKCHSDQPIHVFPLLSSTNPLLQLHKYDPGTL